MIDGITIKPVLLRKGNTKLGMYGIGNVKDTRMHFELMHNRVKMWKPKNAKEYCNLLLIHQNRYVLVYGRCGFNVLNVGVWLVAKQGKAWAERLCSRGHVRRLYQPGHLGSRA